MLRFLFATIFVISSCSTEAKYKASDFIQKDDDAVYVYKYSNNKYAVIERKKNKKCVVQNTLDLKTEFPRDYLLDSKDLKTYLKNPTSDIFYRSSSKICYDSDKIYNDIVVFFSNKPQWNFVLPSGYKYECKLNTVGKKMFFDKESIVVESICINKDQNHTLKWKFAENLGQVDHLDMILIRDNNSTLEVKYSRNKGK